MHISHHQVKTAQQLIFSIDQPVSLQNEATIDAANFSVAAPSPIADAATVSIIVPDAHIPLSGKNSTPSRFLH